MPVVLPEDRLWWRRGGFFKLSPSPGMRRLGRALLRSYRECLTPRGRFLLWALVVFSILGAETRRSQVFVLFAAAAGLLAVPAVMAFLPRPRVRIRGGLPARLTARSPVTLRVAVENASPHALPDLLLFLPDAVRPVSLADAVRLAASEALRPDAEDEVVSFTPRRCHLALGRGDAVEIPITLEAPRRGRLTLRGPAVATVDPLRLMATRAEGGEEQVVLVTPQYYTIPELPIPVGRRYQPGGIPLSSSLGDSIEFVGTREYRAGDPLRNIHWRSWARHGEPVVKEYQEEYFCRIALVLDTFLPPRPREADREGFEAAISVLASIADHFSRSEHVVDILAAGPDLYEVSAGRSLAYLENILDVLACLGPCPEPPFETIGPHLFEKLAQLTTVVAVLLDWDERREAFLAQVKALGTGVVAIIVRGGDTTRDWRGAAGELGGLSRLTPQDVERQIRASREPRGPSERAGTGATRA